MKFKNLTSKTIMVLGGFTAYALFIYFNYNSIAEFIGNATLIVALISYIFFNPAYMFVAYSVYTRFIGRRVWKRVIASTLIIFSLDFLAVPRLGINQALTDGPAIMTNIGAIVMRAMETSMSHSFAYILMYLILPIVGLAISVELLGITNFIKEVK